MIFAYKWHDEHGVKGHSQAQTIFICRTKNLKKKTQESGVY